MAEDDKRFTEARAHNTYDREARLKAIEKEMLKEGPATYRDVGKMNESFVVRSRGLSAGEQKVETEVRKWTRDEALELGQKVSRVPPEHTASVFSEDHKTMEPKLVQAYAHGEKVFAEKETGRSR